MRLQTIVATCVFSACFLLMTSCSKTDPISSITLSQEKKVSFKYNLTAIFSQQNERLSRATNDVLGKMTITDLVGGTVQVIDWPVTLDNEAVTITSNSNFLLTPSSYRFELEVTDGNQTYIGTTETIISDGQQDVSLTVKPVIGDITADFTVTNLPKLTFQYNASELSALTNPKMGYSIDGGAETIVALNKSTGKSGVYMGIDLGVHTIALKLYDDNVQLGKSKVQQESVTITPNGNLVMDIIPLAGELSLTVPTNKGTGRIQINIPSELITEAGTAANLKTVVQLSSVKNGALEQEITLTKNGENYTGTATFSSIVYDIATISVNFIDRTTLELLATANLSSVTINKNAATKATAISVIRRAVISGNIMGTVGVTAFCGTTKPVAGAEIYLNGVLVGLAGSSWGTPAYLKFSRAAGTYTLMVKSGTKQATKTIVIQPLQVSNYQL